MCEIYFQPLFHIQTVNSNDAFPSAPSSRRRTLLLYKVIVAWHWIQNIYYFSIHLRKIFCTFVPNIPFGRTHAMFGGWRVCVRIDGLKQRKTTTTKTLGTDFRAYHESPVWQHSRYIPCAASAAAVLILTLFLSPFSDINIFLFHHISIWVVWHTHHARYFIESFLLRVLLMRVLPSHLLWIVLGEFNLFARRSCHTAATPIPKFIHRTHRNIRWSGHIASPTIKYVNKAIYFILYTIFFGHYPHSARVLCADGRFLFQLSTNVFVSHLHDGLVFGERNRLDFSTFCWISQIILTNTKRKSNTISMTLLAHQGSNLIYSIRRITFIQRLSTAVRD